MADGNFKADHIRQKTNADDVWLSEGGGMTPKRDEYENFLKTAIERRTASFFSINLVRLNHYFSELPVKITSELLNKRCNIPRLATLLGLSLLLAPGTGVSFQTVSSIFIKEKVKDMSTLLFSRTL